MKLEEILPEIRKGRRFRPLPHHPVPLSGGGWYSINQPNSLYKFTFGLDLLREFELEPEKKELSLTQIQSAFNKCVKSSNIDIDWRGRFNSFVQELGFDQP